MSTRPHAQGTVTANTFQQLSTRTWATLQTWTKRCITGHWFEVIGERMYHRQFKESWFCSAQSCKEDNAEAFAGQHAATSTSFLCFRRSLSRPRQDPRSSRGWSDGRRADVLSIRQPYPLAGRFPSCHVRSRAQSLDCSFYRLGDLQIQQQGTHRAVAPGPRRRFGLFPRWRVGFAAKCVGVIHDP